MESSIEDHFVVLSFFLKKNKKKTLGPLGPDRLSGTRRISSSDQGAAKLSRLLSSLFGFDMLPALRPHIKRKKINVSDPIEPKQLNQPCGNAFDRRAKRSKLNVTSRTKVSASVCKRH